MSTDPIAYTYDADYHCEGCAEERFGRDEFGDIVGQDSEGNEVGAVFPWDEWYNWSDGECETLSCGTCHTEIDTVHAEAHSQHCSRYEPPDTTWGVGTRVRVRGFDGIALYVHRNVAAPFVEVVMVGDDTVHTVDISDVSTLADNEYCSGCGQIGCTAEKGE